MKVEEKALVIDYMARGRSSDFKTEPLAQLIGTEFFTLLEVVPKSNVELKVLEEVYVGKGDRDKIEFIKKRISFKNLTNTSLSDVENAIEAIIKNNEPKFVSFFNDSRSITLKRHQIELLPGMGKKHMLQLIKEREKEPFKSFEDIKTRVHSVPDPIRAMVKRIMEELEGQDIKYYLFVRPPSQEKEFHQRRRY